MPYDVTFTTTINGTTVATIALNRGIPGAAANVATAIEAAAALGTPIGSENVGVSDAGVLKKWSLTSLKNWVLDGVSSAWDSLTGTATKVPFNLAPVGPFTEGQVNWNATDHTLNLPTEIADVVIQVGHEILCPVHNNTGSQLNNGTAVVIIGSTGEKMSVAKADATSATHAASVIGVITHDLAHGAEGYATIVGRVREINTNAYNAGDVLYVNPSVAGGLTATKPTAPNWTIRVGWVEKKAGAGAGRIYVHPERFSIASADVTDATDTPSTGKLIKWPSSGTLPPATHTHVSSAITDATATPDATKVALWGTDSAIVETILIRGTTQRILDSVGKEIPMICKYDSGASAWVAGDLNTPASCVVLAQSAGTWQLAIIDASSSTIYTATAPDNGGTYPWEAGTWTITLGAGTPSFEPNPQIAGYSIPAAIVYPASRLYLATTTNDDGAPSIATANISDLAADRGPILTGDNTAARAAINAAMASDYKTTSFTAAKSGRYHVKGSVAADGSVVVTDPSSPAPATGDVYKVVIVGGYVRIGGTDYFKSRHEITRHYTGSAWETVAPYYSEAPDYASGVKAAARSNLGSGAVGDSLFTAATAAVARVALGLFQEVSLGTFTLSGANVSHLGGGVYLFNAAASGEYIDANITLDEGGLYYALFANAHTSGNFVVEAVPFSRSWVVLGSTNIASRVGAMITAGASHRLRIRCTATTTMTVSNIRLYRIF